MDQPAPLIFNAWMEAFYDAVLHHAGLTSGHRRAGVGLRRLRAVAGRGALVRWRLRRRCCGDALAEAVRDLTARFGDDPAAWRWGDGASGGVRPSDPARHPGPGVADDDQRSPARATTTRSTAAA